MGGGAGRESTVERVVGGTVGGGEAFTLVIVQVSEQRSQVDQAAGPARVRGAGHGAADGDRSARAALQNRGVRDAACPISTG